jgi:pyruvate dehydrogenase E1 component
LLAIIIRDGLRAMYKDQETVFYYLTVYNENYPMPAMPAIADIEAGILGGIYRLPRSDPDDGVAYPVHLLGSGAIMRTVLDARDLLREQGVSADVWSVTSYTQLAREARETERWNRLHPEEPAREPFVERALGEARGVFVATTDYVKALPESIARWVPGDYVTLGTDGFGLSESREALRRHFEVDAASIAWAAIEALFRAGRIDATQLRKARGRARLDPGKRNATGIRKEPRFAARSHRA